jgi:alkanesulfonate monooxygenase SsuD/methylene tetrahydromethanopterin reductase-like flavin-dependent oxidoreductase (luciferase family)
LAGGSEAVRRMFEALEIIRKLFTGKDVKHDGEFFKLHTTRLWTLPDTPPPLYIAASGPYTSRKTGELADGLITPPHHSRSCWDPRQVRRGRS